MDPRSRLLAALRGDPVDRVPLVLEGFHLPPDVEVRDPGKLEILERVAPHLHLFQPGPYYVNRYLVTPERYMREIDRQERNGETILTTEIRTPNGPLTAITGRNDISDTTWTIKYPVETRQEIEWIRSIPWELPPDLAPPDMSALPAYYPKRGISYASTSSPFVCVAGMMPYEMFLELCLTDFALIKSLTEQCLARILDVFDVILSAGNIEYVGIYGCEWLTPPMASPQLYAELVQPYERTIIERVHAAGAIAHIHCHGNVRSTLELVIRRGADFFEPVEPPPNGDITFAEAKKVAAGRISLGGNIESGIMETQSVDEVEAAVCRAFDGGKQRMVLQTTAGPIGPMTPNLVRNYHRLVDVWETLSPIA